MSVADGDDAHAAAVLAEERARESEVTNLMRRDLDSNIRRGTCLTADNSDRRAGWVHEAGWLGCQSSSVGSGLCG